MSSLLRKISQNIDKNENLKKKMKEYAKEFFSAVEISAQEAVYFLLSLDLWKKIYFYLFTIV